jgi:predicted esterase
MATIETAPRLPDRSTRTLLLLNNTGGNENDLIPLGRELDPNANLLNPRGKVLEIAEIVEALKKSSR